MTRKEYEEAIVKTLHDAILELEPNEFRKLMINMTLVFKGDPEEYNIDVEETIQ